MFRSLRFQLFAGLMVILLGAGLTITISTREQMREALIGAETRAARNVLGQIELQVSNRYRELLAEKLRIVNERRDALEHMGAVTVAAAEAHDRLSDRGQASRAEARALTLDFVNAVSPGGSVQALAMTREGRVLAHSDGSQKGRDLSAQPDIKGRPLPVAVQEDIAIHGHAYILFDDSAVDAGEDGEDDGARDGRRFAYFREVPELDLIIGVSDRIGDVERYVETGVAATVEVLAETLAQVRVVDTGFVFILDDELNAVTPPADWAAPLMRERDPVSGTPIPELLAAAARGDDPATLRYALPGAQAPIEMQAYVSYFRPLGWYVVSTVPSAEVNRPANALTRQQGVIFAMVLGVALMLAWLFALKLTGPLQRLTGYARQLPGQDFTRSDGAQGALDRLADTRSEVGGLARAFRFMEGELRENIRVLLDTTRDKERIESELNIARDIQRGLLPKIFPPFPDNPQIDLHASLTPARHVGGDLFDFYFLDDHRLLFAVGDVADKGVPSALFMAITKTLVKSASGQETDPALMMRRVNEALSADNPRAMFVTLFIGILDIRSGEVDYVNAGQNPPILLSTDGHADLVRPISGPPAGVMEGVVYDRLKLRLASGDNLVVYTDGVTEAMNDDNAEYGTGRLLALLQRLRGQRATRLVDGVLEDVRRHSDGALQSDDLTLLCLTWHDTSPRE
ncbi:SpoIIE family protein phosphatase [Lutimaribacter sp. EGI FJ00015]|uniref:SpoIIE family protein phosphatase n=1 Tax=Lutimaribacter degradans TaxID=2945989 RepID=A0ACC6A062_9RHOB|nr:SpoIIE family protein phosphatase [Lutimaribacter sp. EGI FJ00013]MCM2563731.1 SpoIIE family protein phosphatase [Lutimaribacter sp. EGI FJ00013]MCO0614915.1 SpoIIE family protein phosphatase [Lutimaribacter sp. EGI FJ00015]MCO0637603.1 SpoIIE family protein phosphatase [Lutimaribacter sp. EGI FJ00014]